MACGQPSSAASIWPVWLQSSSIACLPRMTKLGLLRVDDGLQELGNRQRLDRLAVRRLDEDAAVGAHRQRGADGLLRLRRADGDDDDLRAPLPFSFRRTASSTAISSKGFIDILTLARSTPDPSDLTRILTLKSTTRLTGDQNLHAASGSI